MITIEARNVHQALPVAVGKLNMWGLHRGSRNGPVLVSPWPVATTYKYPLERVVFWPQRDANPFLHLYEALWMLAGRNDVAPLLKFTKQFSQYSDDGETLHDAYGYRWRHAFQWDQLAIIVERLKRDSTDRRCVLQMWDINRDLGAAGRAIPCNLIATFQRNMDGELDMVVFNRSNDIIWGCYGANAVHFSMLQEYMALKIGCSIGSYTQISVNWHAYLNDQFSEVAQIGADKPYDYYEEGKVSIIPMPDTAVIDLVIDDIMFAFDHDFNALGTTSNSLWFSMVHDVLFAHHLYKNLAAPEKYVSALEVLALSQARNADWVVAAYEWITRRYTRWQKKMKA